MAKITPTIETMGIAAHAGPYIRSSHGIRGGRRGAATTPAWTIRTAASDGMKPRATPSAYAARSMSSVRVLRPLEALLEPVELLGELGRQLVAERRPVLTHLRQLRQPAVGVDLEQLGHHLRRDVETLGIDPARADRRHEPDGGFLGLRVPGQPAEDPRQHPGVLAEAGPHELAGVVLAEPVDVEDLRHLGAFTPADGQPVVEVVAHVISAERQHRHRIEAQLADLTRLG